MVYNFSSKGC